MNYEIISILERNHIDDLVKLYKKTWWTQGRTKGDIKIMLENSDYVFGVIEENNPDLLAFARVITDKVYKALLLDVIVDENQRGKGIGQLIMNAILKHPVIKQVKHIELYCLDEVMPFYRQWGFTSEPDGLKFLRKENEGLKRG